MRSLYCIATTSLMAAGFGQSANEFVDDNRPQMEARVQAIEVFTKKVERGDAPAAKHNIRTGEKLRLVSGAAEGTTAVIPIDPALRNEPKFQFGSGEGVDYQLVAGEYLWDDLGTARSSIDTLTEPRSCSSSSCTR